MGDLGTWEKVFIGIVMVAALFFFTPSVRAALKNSRKGSGKEWLEVGVLLAVVVLFIVFLISAT